MTDWNEIVTAWAKWVNGEGPGVQATDVGGKWVDWDTRTWINQNSFSEWRVKRPKLFARLLKSRYGINYVTKSDGEADPVIGNSQWIGDWQEVPQDDE